MLRLWKYDSQSTTGGGQFNLILCVVLKIRVEIKWSSKYYKLFQSGNL